jgi:hypothetical protein
MYLLYKSGRPRTLTGLTPRAWIKVSNAKTNVRSEPGLPLGGSTSPDDIWIFATAADLGKDCKAQSVPLRCRQSKSTQRAHPAVDEEWHHILIGQLNWLQQTRSDMANAILYLARGIKQHTTLHGSAAH